MSDIRNKINLIALIALIGAVMTLIGNALAITAYPEIVNWLFASASMLAIIAGILNVLPQSRMEIALVNVVIGIVNIVNTLSMYMMVVEYIGSESIKFGDINIGIWISLAGGVICTIFSISDFVSKKKNL